MFLNYLVISWAYVNILPLLVESKNENITIFYNMYIPDHPRWTDHAIDIVKEQLEHRNNSIIPNAPLYYINIGKNIGELENCNNCEKIMHYDSGNEVETLSHLHDYCTIHKDAKVIYMHNKGSWHHSTVNNRFRNMLNRAIFSSECVNLKTPRTTLRSKGSRCKCNICSARFSPIPYLYMSGNMWVSECSYISKLMHPSKIEAAMTELFRSAPVKKFGNIVENSQPYELGIDRGSHEHWVTSHPDRKLFLTLVNLF